MECTNRYLASELLGVYPMPGGFNQVQSLAQNNNACSISERLQQWSKPCVTALGIDSSSRELSSDSTTTNLLNLDQSQVTTSAFCSL